MAWEHGGVFNYWGIPVGVNRQSLGKVGGGGGGTQLGGHHLSGLVDLGENKLTVSIPTFNLGA